MMTINWSKQKVPQLHPRRILLTSLQRAHSCAHDGAYVGAYGCSHGTSTESPTSAPTEHPTRRRPSPRRGSRRKSRRKSRRGSRRKSRRKGRRKSRQKSLPGSQQVLRVMCLPNLYKEAHQAPRRKGLVRQIQEEVRLQQQSLNARLSQASAETYNGDGRGERLNVLRALEVCSSRRATYVCMTGRILFQRTQWILKYVQIM